MRKNRTFVVIAIIIAVLMLGIGYAAMSGVTLNINGTATATGADANFKVKFDSTTAPTTTKPDAATVTATITDDTNAELEVSGLTTKGQTATATYTIENYSEELSANLAANVTNSNTDYFNVSQNIAKSSIAKGEKTTITVTVELLKTPVTDKSTTIGVEITASPVEAN